MTNVAGKRAVRRVLFDTNYRKSLVQARLLVAQGDPGCRSPFGANPDADRLLAEHLAAEDRVETEGRGRTVDARRLRPDQSNDRRLGGFVGCAAAASSVAPRRLRCRAGFGSARTSGIARRASASGDPRCQGADDDGGSPADCRTEGPCPPELRLPAF
jgi:hypothetical protein